MYRSALRIVSIDDEVIKVNDALRFVESLIGKDSLAFRYAVEDVNIGIEQVIRPICDCGWENEIVMPMDKSFFRPER